MILIIVMIVILNCISERRECEDIFSINFLTTLIERHLNTFIAFSCIKYCSKGIHSRLVLECGLVPWCIYLSENGIHTGFEDEVII